MLPFVPARRGRVLEVGCGEGRFIGSLAGADETWGIEPSPAAEIAARRLDCVFHATFDQAEHELPERYFDLVICNDVIEHMVSHTSFLTKIKKYMAQEAMMIGSIPNVRYYATLFEYLLERDWRYADMGVLDRTHLAFFTRKSLRRTLEAHGFKVLQLRGINTDYRFSNSPKVRAYLIAAYALTAVTLGYFSDIRHLQFAFQATI